MELTAIVRMNPDRLEKTRRISPRGTPCDVLNNTILTDDMHTRANIRERTRHPGKMADAW
jgi:hypothetical protein